MALHQDIIESHILTRIDGCTLASIASCSTTLHHLISSHDKLWSDICRSTWPSTSSPRVNQLISSFHPRAFFSQAYPLPTSNLSRSFSSSKPPSELISAVDIHYKGKLVFSKVHETETVTGWFRCSSFRIDLMKPKEDDQVIMKHPDTCEDIIGDTTLTWIVIDPIGRRAVNLSSHKAVKAKRDSLTGEVQLRFDSILDGHVQCGILVTCGGSEDDGGMQVREVSLVMEDMDGMHLNGRDSLVILHGASEGKRGNGRNRVVEARRRYEDFMKMKRERRERKLRIKAALHELWRLTFGESVFVAFLSFVFQRR